jgi:hypothetical protein
MTEAEWLACTNDPIAMLRQVCFPRHKRKLALFICACWRKVWHLLSPSVQERLPGVEVGCDTEVDERSYHEWQRTLDEIDLEMGEAVWDATGQFRSHWTTQTAQLAAVLLPGICALNYWDWGSMEAQADRVADYCVASGEEVAKSWSNFRSYQCELFRDIFGLLEHSIALDPGWLTWNGGTITRLAQAIYDERAFEGLPVLADALEDAGCTGNAILEHLRGAGPHTRGCWALDLLLNKV